MPCSMLVLSISVAVHLSSTVARSMPYVHGAAWGCHISGSQFVY